MTSDTHYIDALKKCLDMIDGMKETALLQPPQCAPEPVEVPPGFVCPKPVDMLPTMQASLDRMAEALGLPPGCIKGSHQ